MDDGLNIVVIVSAALVTVVLLAAFGAADASPWLLGAVVLVMVLGTARITVAIDNTKARRALARARQLRVQRAAADAAHEARVRETFKLDDDDDKEPAS
jgi:hypothetical protein